MPKWRFEFPILSLTDSLKTLGMKSAFDGADFSGITGQAGLVIQDVLHKAVVIVDEEGTEAAAACSTQCTPGSTPTLG